VARSNRSGFVLALLLSILFHALLLLIPGGAGRPTSILRPDLRATFLPAPDPAPASQDLPEPVERPRAPPVVNPSPARAASPQTMLSRALLDPQFPKGASLWVPEGGSRPPPAGATCRSTPTLPLAAGMRYEEVLRHSLSPPLRVRLFSPPHHHGPPYVAVEFRMPGGGAYSAVLMQDMVMLHGAMDALNAEWHVREVFLAALERIGGATRAEIALMRLSGLDAVWGARLDPAVRARYWRAVEILQAEARGQLSPAEAQALLSANFPPSPGGESVIRDCDEPKAPQVGSSAP